MSHLPNLSSFTPYNAPRPTVGTSTLDSQHSQAHVNDDAPQFAQQPSTATHSRTPSAPKRAYRQRRKDPSCDVCRDRKVKCDATDDICCSECLGRGVRCQFTKDTNRRMSSMKQIQDLQTKLSVARRQITQLESALQRLQPTDGITEQRAHVAQARDNEPRAFYGDPSKFEFLRRNINIYGRCLIRMTGESDVAIQSTQTNVSDMYLPPARTTHILKGRCFEWIGPWCPLVDQGLFEDTVDLLYQCGRTASFSKAWIGVFYAVLACGAIAQTNNEDIVSVEEQRRFLDLASDNITSSSRRICLDNIIATALLAICHLEMAANDESAIWLATSVRMAQLAGLHASSVNVSATKVKARRKVWCCICVLDRIVALELGLPTSISADGSNVSDPTFRASDMSMDGIDADDDDDLTTPKTTFSAILSVINLVGSSCEALTSTACSTSTAAAIVARLDTFIKSADRSVHRYAILLLQACQLMLHRHNLSPNYKQQQRHEALKLCLSIAEATEKQMRRHTWPTATVEAEVAIQHEQARGTLVICLPSFICRHLWRCILLLCLAGEYSTARSMITFSASVGFASALNLSCCRYIRFFLQLVIDKAAHKQNMPDDEELIVYASADLQQNPHTAWIWPDVEHTSSSPSIPGLDISMLTQHFTPVARDSIDHATQAQEWQEVQDLLRHLEALPEPWLVQAIASSADANRSESTSSMQRPEVARLSSTELPSLYSVMASSPNLKQHLSRFDASQSITPSVSPTNRISIKDII